MLYDLSISSLIYSPWECLLSWNYEDPCYVIFCILLHGFKPLYSQHPVRRQPYDDRPTFSPFKLCVTMPKWDAKINGMKKKKTKLYKITFLKDHNFTVALSPLRKKQNILLSVRQKNRVEIIWPKWLFYCVHSFYTRDANHEKASLPSSGFSRTSSQQPWREVRVLLKAKA